MPQSIDEALRKLSGSRFRSRFHLTQRDLDYVLCRGWLTIREHAKTFIRDRLAPAEPSNDGAQTPMRGHPVFIAQHACACCCRKCLEKWYRVPQHVPLSALQQERIVNLLMEWIIRETEHMQSVRRHEASLSDHVHKEQSHAAL